MKRIILCLTFLASACLYNLSAKASSYLHDDDEVAMTLISWIEAKIPKKNMQDFVSYISNYARYLNQVKAYKMLKPKDAKYDSAKKMADDMDKEAINEIPAQYRTLFSRDFNWELLQLTHMGDERLGVKGIIQGVNVLNKIKDYLNKTHGFKEAEEKQKGDKEPAGASRPDAKKEEESLLLQSPNPKKLAEFFIQRFKANEDKFRTLAETEPLKFLGLNNGATQKEITAAGRAIAKIWHADLWSGDKNQPTAEEIFKLTTTAIDKAMATAPSR